MSLNRDHEAGRRRGQRLHQVTITSSPALERARERNLAGAQRAEAERWKARTR